MTRTETERHGYCSVCKGAVHEYPSGIHHAGVVDNHEPVPVWEESRTYGQVGGFTPDRTKPAAEERDRLTDLWKGATRAGYENVAAELLELDSDIFDVNDEGVEWR